MSFLFKSSNGAATEKTLTLEEQQQKINELRKELGEHSSAEIQCFLSDASCSRFLRARNWNVQKASKMMKSAVKWRTSYKPEKINWDDIAHEAETGKIYRADYKDKHGRTVLVLRPGLENTTSGKGQIKYLVYCLEKAIMNLTEDQEKMVWLTDFQSWTLGSTPLKVTRETVNVLQDCYPERLGLAILYNPPRIFESFWKPNISYCWQIVKPFLDHETYKKVKFVYSSDKESQKIMADVFDLDKLDSAFGGNNPATFEYNSYAERMRADDIKMGSSCNSNDITLPQGHPHVSADKEANNGDSDASSEASFYSGTESPKHEEGGSEPKNG
uniref:CRAL-TRIO domain-containing protein n=1 Tax=Leersia perrieri TaxID=77586 RepID=A0A0D9UZC4_9ORYZ